MIKLGFHLSISGGVSNAPAYAAKHGYGTFQLFLGSSRSWHSNPIDKKEVEKFRGIVAKNNLYPFAHIPYLCNPSSPDTNVHSKSIEMIIENMEKCNALGIKYLVLHMGSHKGTGIKRGISNIESALSSSLDAVGNVELLLENSAGYKNSIGSRFDEIGHVIDLVGKKRLGLCLDTCHAFAAGYDIRNPEKLDVMIEEIDSSVGKSKIKLVHLNDARYGLGSGLDRHWHIGMGEIGRDGFVNLFRNSAFSSGFFIMETPTNSQGNESTNMAEVLSIISEAGRHL